MAKESLNISEIDSIIVDDTTMLDNSISNDNSETTYLMTMQYKVKLKEGKGIDLLIIYNTNQVIEIENSNYVCELIVEIFTESGLDYYYEALLRFPHVDDVNPTCKMAKLDSLTS